MRLIGRVCTALLCWMFVRWANSKPQNNSTLCFDCNYAPSGFAGSWSNGTSGQTGGQEREATEVGYVPCALAKPDDAPIVATTDCQSNRCFIRLDPNGLVYRGCANPPNLPADVDSSQQCKYQGDWESLWWFCDGNLCNSGQLGESGSRCGDTSTTSSNSGSTSGSSGSSGSTRRPSDAGRTSGGYVDYTDGDVGSTGASGSQSRDGGSSSISAASGQPTAPTSSVAGGTGSSGGQNNGQYYTGGSQQNTGALGGADVSPTSGDNSPALSNDFQLTLMLQVKNGKSSANNPGDSQDDTFHTDSLSDVSQQSGTENDFSGSSNSRNQGNSGSNGNQGNSGSSSNQGNQRNQGNGGSNSNSGSSKGSYGNSSNNGSTESPLRSTQDDTIIYALLCDGDCRENPSGLHVDPFNETRFIQCGIGVKHDDPHSACTCCHPYIMTCPLETFFDDTAKVCVTAYTNYFNSTN